MQFGSRERWVLRGRELKRRVWRWDAGREWGLIGIAIACLPIGLFLVVFPVGDTDRLGALVLALLGLATGLGLIAYLDRKIDKREEHRRRFPFD